MSMFNPPHAGMLIKDVIETKGISATELPCALKLQDSTVAKLLNGELNISEEMARRIEEVLTLILTLSFFSTFKTHIVFGEPKIRLTSLKRI